MIYNLVDERSAGIEVPDGLEPDDMQLASDGRNMLVLADGTGDQRGTVVLFAATVDAAGPSVAGWVELLRWDSDDADRPATFNANDVMRWTGGDTAWIITESEQLLRVTLTS